MPVSVVIPAYNAAATLGEALASIRVQRRPVTEIIVVDDGSTDATADIATATAGVTVLRQANGGAAAALNAGMEIASGSIIAFLDSDDLWTPDAVAVHLENLSKRPEADGSVGWFEEFVSPTVAEAAARRFQPRQPQIGWLSGSTFVRAESFRRVGSFDNEAREWPWIDWAHRAKLKGLVFAVMDRLVLKRRLHPSSLSMREGNKGGANMIGAARQALQRHRSGRKVE
jgi:glycosyltransferase involved in cell wall biosynthesis